MRKTEQLRARCNITLPEDDQEQKDQKEQRPGTGNRQVQRLVVSDLAGNAGFLLRRRRMRIQHARSVQNERAEQHALDQPAEPRQFAPALLSVRYAHGRGGHLHTAVARSVKVDHVASN